ncbi:MAG TPA: hypothetical protein VFY67_01035 [Pyrinomonadaceae bacterium]|nr:hypothetical protein [Pyrinomonadaceae bacterium]
MTRLNTVLGTLTGPRGLRSALRQKTVAIGRVLNGLDGPSELCVRIPAAVFGGDIFGVMSSQLRDALIVAQAAPVPQVNRERRRLNELSAFENSQNPFQPISQLHKPSTNWPTFDNELTRTSLPSSEGSTKRSAPPFSPPEEGIFRKGIGASLAWEDWVKSVKPGVDPVTSARTKQFPATPPTPATAALVSSLNRYWQTVREGRDTSHAQPQALAETSANTTGFHVTDSEQHTAARAWSNLVGRDVSDKLRSFTNTTNPFQKPARLSSTPERQVQNVFNIEVNHANQHSANFDDLGDRIAQILHEQALQHGIDVT